MPSIIVLHAPLPGHECAQRDSYLLAALPYAKRLDLERRDPAQRRATLAGIALVLALAARLRGEPARAADLRFPGDGKPFLDGGPFFSVSHTTGRVACAASLDLECGLDIEYSAPERSSDLARAERLRRWTAVEAVLKAAGVGLRNATEVGLAPDLKTAMFRGATHYLQSLSVTARVIAHLAALAPPDSVTIEAFPAELGVPLP